MIAVLGALLCGVTIGLLALSVRPPAPRLRHEAVKNRGPRRDFRRRARFRVRSGMRRVLHDGGASLRNH